MLWIIACFVRNFTKFNILKGYPREGIAFFDGMGLAEMAVRPEVGGEKGYFYACFDIFSRLSIEGHIVTMTAAVQSQVPESDE